MRIKKVISGMLSVIAMVGLVVFTSGATVGATSGGTATQSANWQLGLERVQFSATGFPTFFEQNITNPPQIGQGFTLDESLKDTNGATIGTSHIECKVIGFTTTSLVFACKGTFTFNNGDTLKVVTSFNFDPASLPALYDAYIIGGTGAYAGAFGVIHVTDPGPGNPTGYVFDFYKW